MGNTHAVLDINVVGLVLSLLQMNKKCLEILVRQFVVLCVGEVVGLGGLQLLRAEGLRGSWSRGKQGSRDRRRGCECRARLLRQQESRAGACTSHAALEGTAREAAKSTEA